MSAPPLIGITAGNDPNEPGFYVVRPDYLRSVELSGGIPVVLAPSGPALHPAFLDRLDGLVVTGGVDVSPELYGEAPHATVDRVNLERDEFERKLLEEAVRRELPVLGICRGCQMLNVALGGTLVQDVPSLVGTAVAHDDRKRPREAIAHAVHLAEGTRLAGLLGAGELQVNSFHHQAVGALGEGLIATAWAEDGVIEGIELEGDLFAVGVQWHPEAFWKEPERFGPLFRGLVDAARAFRHERDVWWPHPVSAVPEEAPAS